MIENKSFTKEHILTIKQKYPHLDQFIIERTIFAFGLLEALVRVDLPFIFKGGTSLILLLNKPYRLSTDIDIIVNPEINIEPYLDEATKIFPFIKKEEQTRRGKNAIVKSHYKFYYKSPSTEDNIPILLDVLYEKHGYSKLIKKQIKNELIITKDSLYEVTVPTIEAILGDKLTAFAPYTTGIGFEYPNKKGELTKRYLEVAKQFLDVSKLIEEVKDFDDVEISYRNVVLQEINYRGLDIKAEDALKDTFNASLSIVSKGNFHKEYYEKIIDGTRRIQNHVYGITINGESIVPFAADVMLICARLITNIKEVKLGDMPLFNGKEYRVINAIKKIDVDTFNKIAVAMKLIE